MELVELHVNWSGHPRLSNNNNNNNNNNNKLQRRKGSAKELLKIKPTTPMMDEAYRDLLVPHTSI